MILKLLFFAPRRHGAGAMPVGLRQARGGVAKKIGFAAGQLEQSLLGHRMRLDAAVAANMAGRKSPPGQCPANQQTTVAIQRVAFGAKQADAMADGFIDDARVRRGIPAVPPWPRSRRCRHNKVSGRAGGRRARHRPCRCCSWAANALLENHGHQRENGSERTSTMALTPASVSNAMKRSAGRLEWPMVRRSAAAVASIMTGQNPDLRAAAGPASRQVTSRSACGPSLAGRRRLLGRTRTGRRGTTGSGVSAQTPAFARRGMADFLAATGATLLAAAGLLVDRCPGAPLGFVRRDAALLVAFLDVLRLALLLPV